MAYINLGQVIYPVGAYFFSDNSISPSSLFGGTWVAVDAGRFICAAGSGYGYSVGQQGGANFVTLTCQHLPAAVWLSTEITSGLYPTTVNSAVEQGNLYGIHTVDRSTENTLREAHENRPLYRVAYIWRRTS